MSTALCERKKLYRRAINSLTPSKSQTEELSISSLGSRVFGNSWLTGKHITLLQTVIERISAGDLKRVIIEMPPRHGKSTMICELGVPWYLSKHPDHRVIYTTFAAQRATVWGRLTRDVIINQGPQLGISLSSSTAAANEWYLQNHRGGMQSAGIGGPLIGGGAHLFIIDDAVKNEEEADSPLIQERNWDWFSSTARSRLEPGAAIVIIMHRWSRNDLVGKILEDAAKTGENWEVIRMPALAEEADVLGRQPGETLWPERFSQVEMEEKKKTTPPRWWSALYQQNPINEDGAEWPEEWFTWDGIWVDEFPDELSIKTLALDPSKGKTDKPGDYSAFAFVGVDRNGIVYLACDMDNRRSAEKIVSDGVALIKIFNPDGFAIETNAFAELFGILFKAECAKQSVPLRFTPKDQTGPLLVKYQNTDSKVGRIRRWGKLLGERKVRFVRSLRTRDGHVTIPLQTELMVKQFMEFPHCTIKTGGHDDGPDSGEMALRLARDFSKHQKLLQKLQGQVR